MAEPVVISRWSGMGDVCMALCAAHAYKAINGGTVLFQTDSRFHGLARACHHVDFVVPEGHQVAREFRKVALHDASHGLSEGHEVDSFCAALGLGTDVEDRHKTLDLQLSLESVQGVEKLIGDWADDPASTRRIAIHPGAIDRNRTWPIEHWVELVECLLWKGLHVVLIGQPGKAHPIARLIDPLSPVNNLKDLTGLLNPLQTVALLRRCAALISTDGGPIQLAGATTTAIIGLYSVVKGANRIPYRVGGLGMDRILEPNCLYAPCYRFTQRVETWAHQTELLAAVGVTGLGPILGNWCPSAPPLSSSRYHCLNKEITPARVMRAILEVL